MNNGPIFGCRPGISVTINEDEDILNNGEDEDDESYPLEESENNDDPELNDENYVQEDINDVQSLDNDELDESINDPPRVQGANDEHSLNDITPSSIMTILPSIIVNRTKHPPLTKRKKTMCHIHQQKTKGRHLHDQNVQTQELQ